MGLNITIDKNIEKLMSNYQKELVNNLKKKIDEVTPSVEKRVLDLVENKLTEFYNAAVLKFYNSYPNRIYDPRGSLYNLFRTKREGKTLKYWFEPSEIPSRTGYAEEDGLYTTVFKEGWHGGARHDEVMRYRTPIPYYTYWGKESTQTLSAYDMFIDLKEDYEKHGFNEDYRDIWVSSLSTIGFNVK